MTKRLYTADWHLFHKNILAFCQRPFRNLEQMHAAIWEELDALRAPDTELHFLGDFMMGHPGELEEALYRIDMPIHFYYGNHDGSPAYHRKIERHPRVVWAGDLKRVKLGPDNIPATLCHYPMRSWAQNNHGALQIHGHSHGTMNPYSNQLDIGIDNAYKLLGAYRPFTEEEVVYFAQHGTGELP